MKNKQTQHDVLIELSVTDFEVTKKFYGALGFLVIWEEPAKKMNGYLVMKRHKSILCFFCGNDQVYNHPYFKRFDRNTTRGCGVEFSIPVENIEKYYQKLVKILPNQYFIQKLKLQPWGVRDFRMVDPFGYYFRVNTPTNIISPLVLGDKYYQ